MDNCRHEIKALAAAHRASLNVSLVGVGKCRGLEAALTDTQAAIREFSEDDNGSYSNSWVVTCLDVHPSDDI